MGHSCRPRHRLVKKACARGAPAVQPCSYEFSISRDSHCFAFCIFGMSKLVLRYRAESGASGLPAPESSVTTLLDNVAQRLNKVKVILQRQFVMWESETYSH
ncbi:hypothetical protein RB195_007766 [Necator americanus]|uniref:Uncharacterized protein n=1 Tax=Necator americanus TaxID=51031 RepID=A0ABR1C1I5_NECAM